MKWSFIIPVFNEEEFILECLEKIQVFRKEGHEVIVADGGSDDNTITLAEPLCDKVISSEKGRARQMNAAVTVATGEVLLFLHADTIITFGPDEINDKRINDNTWGCFWLRLSGGQTLFRIYEYFINLRSKVTGIVTGDQVLFVNHRLFNSIEGYQDIPLMEDVAISKKLKKINRPIHANGIVISSSRRWEEYGIIKMMLKMWSLRLKYAFGVSPVSLAQEYDRA